MAGDRQKIPYRVVAIDSGIGICIDYSTKSAEFIIDVVNVRGVGGADRRKFLDGRELRQCRKNQVAQQN